MFSALKQRTSHILTTIGQRTIDAVAHVKQHPTHLISGGVGFTIGVLATTSGRKFKKNQHELIKVDIADRKIYVTENYRWDYDYDAAHKDKTKTILVGKY